MTKEKVSLIKWILKNFKNYILSLITTVPNSVLNEIQKIQKLLWYSSKPKINYKPLCNTFEEGGLKNVDVKAKILLGQCTSIVFFG